LQKAFLFLSIINKKILYAGIASLSLLCLSLAIFSVGFSSVKIQDYFVLPAYIFTQSAGKFGTLAIVLITAFCYTIRLDSVRQKWYTFFRALFTLLVFIGVMAFVNEHLTKPLLKEVRPSHYYMLQSSNQIHLLDSLYHLNKDERLTYFNQLVEQNRNLFAQIDTRVLQHWVEEAGFSFPSGHSFNAFLLATIIAFSLRNARNRILHQFYLIPFIWAVGVAVSRVALGAHTEIDVCFGASLGFAVAVLFIYFDTTRNLLFFKRY